MHEFVPNQIVSCAEYGEGRKLRDVALDDVSEILPSEDGDRFVWIGLYEPDEGLLRRVQGEFGLHDLAIEDALRAHQRPKVEEYGDGLFVVLRTAHPSEDGNGLHFGETHLFVGPRYVVSIRHGASLPYTGVRHRCESTPQLLSHGPGFVLYALMDFVVDQYFPVVDAFEDRLGALEDQIFGGSPQRGVTQEIYELKTDLLHFKRAVAPLIEVCNRLLRFDNALIGAETRTYLRDVYDHVLRVNESMDQLRDMAASALEANLALVGVAQNDVMKALAGWAAILAVPTLIAGIYGMNFDDMPELRSPHGYPAALLGMVAICGTMFWRFRRAGWL
jgi:magnesium transporter